MLHHTVRLSIRRLWFLPLFAVAAACLALSPTSAALAQSKERNEFLKSSPKVIAAFKEVVSKAAPSTVRVQCDGKVVALGTVASADGLILTKASELKGKIVCRFKDERELEARVIGEHDKFDLALLKVEASNLKPVQWSESQVAPVGHWVASPGTGEDPVAIGVVSVAARELPLDRIPLPLAGTAYLGITMNPEEKKAKIAQVQPRSPAEKAGLKTDDLILSLAGKAIEDQQGIMKIVQDHKPGEEVPVRIKRGDEELELKVTLGKRPANRGDVQNSLGSELSKRRSGFPSVLQNDQVIKPSDCGGPLVDLDGRVIGVNIARAGRTESFAIPSEAVLNVLADLKAGRFPPRAGLAERLKAAQESFEKAEAERLVAEKKLAEAKAALEKAEAEKTAAAKKAEAALAALKKAEAEAKPEKKPEPVKPEK